MNQMKGYGSAWSNWAILLQQEVAGVYEVAITAPSASGSELDKLRRELDQAYVPNKIVLGGASGTLPLLEGTFTSEPMIYVCRNKTCRSEEHTSELPSLMRNSSAFFCVKKKTNTYINN